MSFIYLYCLNVDVVCNVSTQMSYVYLYCLYINVVSSFVLFTNKSHAQQSCLNNTLYFTHIWNEAIKNIMLITYFQDTSNTITSLKCYELPTNINIKSNT
jgi:hypothetical protein